MAFAVQMRVDPELEKAMASFKVSDTQRSLVITIKDEAMVMALDAAQPKTDDFTSDLAQLKASLKDKVGVDTASYVLLRVAQGKDFAMLMYIPVTTKPKNKMIFASSAMHLRSSCNLGIAGETRIEDLEDLVPKLFNVDEEEKKEMRTEMRTELEVTREEISKMEVCAPAGPLGLGCALTPELKAALAEVKDKKLKGVVAALDGNKVNLDGKIDADTPNADVHKCINANEKPRYAVIQWEDDKNVMAYICPASAKPREKMPYASTKPSFVKCVEAEGVKIVKSVEMAETSSLEETIKEHLADMCSDNKAMDEMKPIAPAAKMPKGPRMLI